MSDIAASLDGGALHIFIIEDDAEVRKSLKLVLESCG